MADNKLLRFKDVLSMDDKHPLSLSDLHVSEYMPGEDESVNYRAYRRKRTIGSGEGGPVSESTDMDEALTIQQRLARSRQLKKYKSKIKLGREKAKRRIAGKDKLMKRARKQARNAILKKLIKDTPKGDLSYQRRQELEKRLETPAMKKRIAQIANKLFPKVRKAELDKKRGGAK